MRAPGFPFPVESRSLSSLASRPGTAEGETQVTEPVHGPGTDPIEILPVVVLSQVFPARPSSIPSIREFVRRCLAESPLTDEGTREVGETVFRALLDAAGPPGARPPGVPSFSARAH